jgi:hypothetical protein
MKVLLLSALIFTSLSALADSEIRSSNGSSCSQSDFQPLELSGELGKGDFNSSDDYNNSYDSDENYGSVKLSYKFGGADPIDCTRFQSIVEREAEAYTSKLEMQIDQLRAQILKQERISASKVKFR